MSSAEISGEGKHSNPTPAWPDEATTTGAGDHRIGGMDDDLTTEVSKEDLDKALAGVPGWKAGPHTHTVETGQSSATPTTTPPDSGEAEPNDDPSQGRPSGTQPSQPRASQPGTTSSTSAQHEKRPPAPPQAPPAFTPRVAAADQRRGERERDQHQGRYDLSPYGVEAGQFYEQHAQTGSPYPQGVHAFLADQPAYHYPQAPTPDQHLQGHQQEYFFQQPSAAPAVANGSLADGLAAKFRQESFTTEVKPKPQSGWRKAVLKSSFGMINPGESRAERVDRERRDQVGANIPRTEFIFAVMSPRGGVAKTTTTAALGSVFAKVRGAEVIAIDANPNKGNLASRINPDATATFDDLLRDRRIQGVNDIRTYAKRNAVHLDVLAGDERNVRPAVYQPNTFTDTVNVLRRGYRIIGIDVGQNLQDAVVARILDTVTAVVVVSGLQYGSGKAAVGMYDWLVENGRADLVQRSTLVISDRHPEINKDFRAGLEENLASTLWKDPVCVPYDHHLYEDTVIDVNRLAKPTYRAYLEIAARLSSFYGQPALPLRRSA